MGASNIKDLSSTLASAQLKDKEDIQDTRELFVGQVDLPERE